MGKDEKSVEESRKNRQDFIFKFGFVPESIVLHNKLDRAPDLVVSEGARDYSSVTAYKPTKDQQTTIFHTLNKANLSMSSRSVRAGALSRFSQNIGRFFVKFYCPDNGIVYDPFAGHCSRMNLVHEAERHYIGVDLSHVFMEANRAIKEMILDNDRGKLIGNDCSITLYEQSSSSVPQVVSNSADYTITSPPYWNIEKYGDEPEQLGNAKSFDSFMVFLTEHVRENYRILKPGAYCTWFINDFAKDGIFYCFHAALIEAFKSVGFTLHDITIVDFGTSMGKAFLHTILKTKRFAKRHEYGVTVQKLL
jgi:hypothetical protein